MYSVGKTYSGWYKEKFYIFEVTEMTDNGYMHLDVIHSDNENLLKLGKYGAHSQSVFMLYGDFKESPAIDFTSALVDLALTLKSKDLFNHFTKKGIVS